MEKLNILIPTDFSVQAEYAYLMVKNLESKIKIKVHFLHVLDFPDTVTIDSNGKVETCGDIDVNYVNGQKEICDRNFRNLKDQYGDDIITHVTAGKLTEAINEFLSKESIDLIVMGTKGSWGIKEKVSGSSTQTVVRNSTVPVLSLMCDRSQLEIKNILLVHDYIKPANEELSLLKLLIKSFDPKIHLLQIIDEKKERIWILNQMDEFTKLNGITNYEKHLLNDKDVEAGVIHFNQMHDMDIICIGTHGRKGLSRLIHPSETEKLINHLFKPIISFHLKSN